MQTENNKATEEVESTVSEETRQETEVQAHQKWLWVEAAVWTVRMLAALVNGVKACPERKPKGRKMVQLDG